MPNYRRAWLPGGTYFFTVNLLQRQNNDLLVKHIQELRLVIKDVKAKFPFKIHACVVLPDHLHCIWELPPGDADFAIRWRLIKMNFSKALPMVEHRNEARQRRGEPGIWQRRYWEHVIRDEADYCAHMDYVHINPVKHGYVASVKDWPYSTFHRLVKEGMYSLDWSDGMESNIDVID